MPALAHIAIDESQYPETVQEEMRRSLRTRRINPKFQYQSYRQAEKWCALHRAYAPRVDATSGIYDAAFRATAEICRADSLQVVGLCCGAAEKEARLLEHLRKQFNHVSFLACDASVSIVLSGGQAAEEKVGTDNVSRLVCDLQSASNLPGHLAARTKPSDRRVITCFGSVQNFEPDTIFPRLAGLLRADDLLLLEANLAPAADYVAAMQRILSQYDNPLTAEWLWQLLLELGFEKVDGELHVRVEPDEGKPFLQRIVAILRMTTARVITFAGEQFTFLPEEEIRLFFSYRYTPEIVQTLLEQCGVALLNSWISQRQEEGLFLCRLQ